MPHAFPIGLRINTNSPRFHFLYCWLGLSLTTAMTVSWSEIPGTTLTVSTKVGLLVDGQVHRTGRFTSIYQVEERCVYIDIL